MGGWTAVPTLLTADPPAHTRYRKVIARAFHPNAVNKFEPAVREITSRLIDSWIETGRIEFVSQFGVPLPVEVIARVLNVPDERLADFKRWSDDSIAGIGSSLTDDQRVAAERGVDRAAAFGRRKRDDDEDVDRNGALTGRASGGMGAPAR